MQIEDQMKAASMLFSACKYLKETHGRRESEPARRILTVASRCIGKDTEVDLNSHYIRSVLKTP